MSEPRLRTSLFAAFALLAFVLSAVGIYGVMGATYSAFQLAWIPTEPFGPNIRVSAVA